MPLFNCAGGNGGGGGGTSDYEQLSNLPQVNNNILIGNKSASDLGLVGAVAGKGLSTNDYTNTDKAIVDGVTSALAGKVDNTSVGVANGVAELDANGRVPSSQLPSYVDDVLEYADLAHFPATGETGKIYIADDTNKTYRWSGSGYAEISESLALGETSSTAYAGNKGKANADAIAAIKDGTNIDSFADVETALAGKANSSDLGDKSNLTTTDKSSAVAAVNEVNGKIDALIMTQEFNATIASIAGNSDDAVNIPVTVPSGYKILGVGAAVSGSRNLAITGVSAGANSVTINVYNLFSTALSNVKVYILVQFIKI